MEWFSSSDHDGMLRIPYSRRKRLLVKKEELERERARKQEEASARMRTRSRRRRF
jgi:hypothetical protein